MSDTCSFLFCFWKLIREELVWIALWNLGSRKHYLSIFITQIKSVSEPFLARAGEEFDVSHYLGSLAPPPLPPLHTHMHTRTCTQTHTALSQPWFLRAYLVLRTMGEAWSYPTVTVTMTPSVQFAKSTTWAWVDSQKCPPMVLVLAVGLHKCQLRAACSKATYLWAPCSEPPLGALWE